MNQRLSILGIGMDLPPALDVRAIAESHGANVSEYKGWDRVCHAGPEDHPSTMGARALDKALEESGVSRDDLKLLVFTGSSRDYLPSWSVSTEIMRLCRVGNGCLGVDVTVGCLATLSALDFIHAWLAVRGGGYAAVVASERWSQTIDFSDQSLSGIWSYGDSAGALVVGMNVPNPSLADFLGAECRTDSENNGHVLIPYGGTREPVAPPGTNPNLRRVSDRPKKQITGAYRKGLGDANEALQKRFGIRPTRLLCNQSSPQIVGLFTELLGMEGRAVISGHQTGHLGCVDVLYGLNSLVQAKSIEEPVALVSTTAYAYGIGLLVPPVGREAGK